MLNMDLQVVSSSYIEDDTRENRLISLAKKKILRNEDWAIFKTEFESTFPAFFIRLKKQHPDFTYNEQRLAAFYFLGFTNNEIAGITGIRTDSIKKARQRMRKKLAIPPEDRDLYRYFRTAFTIKR